MLKLSTKGHYGTRLMFELALNFGKGPMSLARVSKSQGISGRYLGNLISSLKQARLVSANRGASGGYELTKPPKQISLADIVQAVEGPLAISDCAAGIKCKRSSLCVVGNVWKNISDKMKNALDSVSLQDIVDLQKQHTNQIPMYNI